MLCTTKCTKPTVQLPSNNQKQIANKEDSLLQLNSALIEEEDSIIQSMVSVLPENYIKSEMGFWYNITQKTEGKSYQKAKKCKAKISIRNLGNKHLNEEVINIDFGKKQIVTGLEEGLKLLNKGEKATFIIPWYLAYGMKGNGNTIAPYTSLKIDVNTDL